MCEDGDGVRVVMELAYIRMCLFHKYMYEGNGNCTEVMF